MRRPHPVQVLLGVRRRNEELEERKLTEILSKRREAQTELGRIRAKLDSMSAARVEQVEHVIPATDHQQTSAELRALLRLHDDVISHSRDLELRQAEQMMTYLSAHRERKLIEEMDARRLEAHNNEVRMREQKQTEELFLMRRDRDRDTAVT